jgi:aminoglycoside phosphotransferase (APT) family kinase protein
MNAIDEATLLPELERVLGEHFGRPVSVRSLERRPCAYRTSFPLEELDVELADRTLLRMMLKDLGRAGLSPDAARAKPRFMHDPAREIQTYRNVLGPAQLGTPEFYGDSTDAPQGRHWLFIERVEGDVLWQVGELETWAAAARWLARLHERCAGRTNEWPFLIAYDRAYWSLWIERAGGFAAAGAGKTWDGEARAQICWLADRYAPVVDRLAALPATLVHGEFYPSNILVGHGSDPAARRIAPIDWELAGAAPGLIDLAALTTGWSSAESAAIVGAYRERYDPATGGQAFDDALAACRLHLAVQWLAWEPSWSPPVEHRRDWVAEAIREAKLLSL